MIFENKKEPLLPQKVYFRRVVRTVILSVAILAISLTIGTIGYHVFADLPWVDAFLNASMILTGMGPIDRMTTDSAKLFASFYALYSGIAFLSTAGLLVSPFIHRLMHKFHAAEEEKN
jgi:hypothetical protein